MKKLLLAGRILPRRQAEVPWSRDVVRLNLRKPLPFDDDTFQVIYCSHALEHLYFEDAWRLLGECHRVLQCSGVCRFVVPDVASAIARYQEAKQRGDATAANTLMQELLLQGKAPPRGLIAWYHLLTAFHQHKWMYDVQSLKLAFQEAGFSDACSASYLDSRIQRIREVEDPGRILDGQGIAVEGTKERQ
ncbi:MAG: methyltransferase domain-containing protein [Planctomycetes bacterium]|nr:methyltransferase domain-containing protein [Planctomycetota bacterium]